MKTIKFGNKERELVLEVVSGSRAYGLATESADTDVRGVFLPSEDDILGFGYRDTHVSKPDKQHHSLRKYLHLCLKANPSLLAWLWVKDEFVRELGPVGYDLRLNRRRLLSKLVHKTFGGYARSQLKKMEKSYGSDRGYAMHRERDATKDLYSVAAGYDAKNALHLIRLLRCGVELLTTGKYRVWREHDREELLAIRHGGWPFGRVMDKANLLFDYIDAALEDSPLPDEPDREWAENFLVQSHKAIVFEQR